MEILLAVIEKVKARQRKAEGGKGGLKEGVVHGPHTMRVYRVPLLELLDRKTIDIMERKGETNNEQTGHQEPKEGSATAV